jgi:hypothetical protein
MISMPDISPNIRAFEIYASENIYVFEPCIKISQFHRKIIA